MRGDQILLSGAISFIGGVGMGSFFAVRPEAYLIAAAVWIAAMVVFQWKSIFISGAFLFLFVVGAMQAEHATDHFRLGKISGGEYVGVARIVADPEERSFYRRVILRAEDCESDFCPADDILWQAPLAFSAEAGTRINLSCALVPPENFDPEFDYRMFLAKDGIGYVCDRAKRAEISGTLDIEGSARAWLYRPKHALEEALGRSISDPEAALGKGLILGGDRHLPERLQDLFARIGLSHIVAVSGYNIAIIAQGTLILGIGAGLWRRRAVWVSLAVIVLFVLMIGAPSSAIRAAVMASIAFLAAQSGRLSRPVVTLVFALALMLVAEPLLLRYDIGFQLSFLATLAIIIASSWEAEFLPHEFLGKGFVETIWFSLMAELFVLPIIMFQFHAFSPLMLLSNVLILPLVPYAMLFSFLSALAFLILPGAYLIFAWIAYPILSVITRIPEMLSALSWASLPATGFGIAALIVWYAVLFSGIVGIERYARQKHRTEAFSLPRDR
jgi:competence protein ComEC